MTTKKQSPQSELQLLPTAKNFASGALARSLRA